MNVSIMIRSRPKGLNLMHIFIIFMFLFFCKSQMFFSKFLIFLGKL